MTGSGTRQHLAGTGAPPPPGGSLEHLRERNLAHVISALLRSDDPMSRTEIARRTGLSRTTAASAVTDLVRAGLVREEPPVGAPTHQGGRPPMLVTLEQSAGAAVGVDFDQDRVNVAVADLRHTILAEEHETLVVGKDGHKALDTAARLVRRVLRRAGVSPQRVLGVGLSIPAPVDPTGVIQVPAILPGWEGLDPSRELSARLDLPVLVDNDANLGALAEAVWGAGRGHPDSLFLLLRGGIGVGLMLRGEIYRGAGGLAGEIGHVTLDENGQMCHCGNRGCLETVASEPAILGLLRNGGHTYDSIPEVIAAARDGDRACRRVLADAGRSIGTALAMACNLLNPERVIVGGELRTAGDLVIDPAREALQRQTLGALASGVEVVAAELGVAAELYGALALVLMTTDQHLSARLAQPA